MLSDTALSRLFAREFFVFEVVSLEHLHERIAEQELVLSVVRAEGHLLQVGRGPYGGLVHWSW